MKTPEISFIATKEAVDPPYSSQLALPPGGMAVLKLTALIPVGRITAMQMRVMTDDLKMRVLNAKELDLQGASQMNSLEGRTRTGDKVLVDDGAPSDKTFEQIRTVTLSGKDKRVADVLVRYYFSAKSNSRDYGVNFKLFVGGNQGWTEIQSHVIASSEASRGDFNDATFEVNREQLKTGDFLRLSIESRASDDHCIKGDYASGERGTDFDNVDTPIPQESMEVRLKDDEAIAELGSIHNNGSQSEALAQFEVIAIVTDELVVERGSSTSVYGKVSGSVLSTQEEFIEIPFAERNASTCSLSPTLVAAEPYQSLDFNVCLSNVDQTGLTSPLYNLSYAPTPPLIDAGEAVDTYLVGERLYRVHSFTQPGRAMIRFPFGADVEVVVVAGGGGGGAASAGHNAAAGGGGGGVIHRSKYSIPIDEVVEVIVGDGGDAAAGRSEPGRNGHDSRFGNLVALGGGGGASTDSGPSDGGSGGGGNAQDSSYRSGGRALQPDSGSGGMGNDGGDNEGAHDNSRGSGGGGALESGGTVPSPGSGEGFDGGKGYTTNITGTNVMYGAGGGGGRRERGYRGGLGGGVGVKSGASNGGGFDDDSNPDAEDAPPNQGGGGGGGGTRSRGQGGKGGSGIVIIRYEISHPDDFTRAVENFVGNALSFRDLNCNDNQGKSIALDVTNSVHLDCRFRSRLTVDFEIGNPYDVSFIFLGNSRPLPGAYMREYRLETSSALIQIPAPGVNVVLRSITNPFRPAGFSSIGGMVETQLTIEFVGGRASNSSVSLSWEPPSALKFSGSLDVSYSANIVFDDPKSVELYSGFPTLYLGDIFVNNSIAGSSDSLQIRFLVEVEDSPEIRAGSNFDLMTSFRSSSVDEQLSTQLTSIEPSPLTLYHGVYVSSRLEGTSRLNVSLRIESSNLTMIYSDTYNISISDSNLGYAYQLTNVWVLDVDDSAEAQWIRLGGYDLVTGSPSVQILEQHPKGHVRNFIYEVEIRYDIQLNQSIDVQPVVHWQSLPDCTGKPCRHYQQNSENASSLQIHSPKYEIQVTPLGDPQGTDNPLDSLAQVGQTVQVVVNISYPYGKVEHQNHRLSAIGIPLKFDEEAELYYIGGELVSSSLSFPIKATVEDQHRSIVNVAVGTVLRDASEDAGIKSGVLSLSIRGVIPAHAGPESFYVEHEVTSTYLYGGSNTVESSTLQLATPTLEQFTVSPMEVERMFVGDIITISTVLRLTDSSVVPAYNVKLSDKSLVDSNNHELFSVIMDGDFVQPDSPGADNTLIVEREVILPNSEVTIQWSYLFREQLSTSTKTELRLSVEYVTYPESSAAVTKDMENDLPVWHLLPSTSPTPSRTATVTASTTASVTATVTATRTPSRTMTPTGSRSETPTPTRTMTSTATFTATPSWTPTSSQSRTATSTSTPSPSSTRTGTSTVTSSWTATPSQSSTGTPSKTPSSSQTRSPTSTFSPTQTCTPTETSSHTLSPSSTATESPSMTSSRTASITASSSPSSEAASRASTLAQLEEESGNVAIGSFLVGFLLVFTVYVVYKRSRNKKRQTSDVNELYAIHLGLKKKSSTESCKSQDVENANVYSISQNPLVHMHRPEESNMNTEQKAPENEVGNSLPFSFIEMDKLDPSDASNVRIVSAKQPNFKNIGETSFVSLGESKIRIARASDVDPSQVDRLDRFIINFRVWKAKVFAEPPPVVEVNVPDEVSNVGEKAEDEKRDTPALASQLGFANIQQGGRKGGRTAFRTDISKHRRQSGKIVVSEKHDSAQERLGRLRKKEFRQVRS